MYSYVKENQTGGKTAKGIKKIVIKNDVKHEDYKRVLLNDEQIYHISSLAYGHYLIKN